MTLANALDYETSHRRHTFTVTATDGVTTVSEEFTLNVTDMTINTLAVTLANSGAALAESSSSGTAQWVAQALVILTVKPLLTP